MIREPLLLTLLALTVSAASCTSGSTETDGDSLNRTFAAQLASSWHNVGDPQRVQVGIVVNDANGRRFITQGTINITFAPLDGGGEPGAPSVTAAYVPVPGTDASGDVPTVTSGARGVYEAEDVTFDQPGVWRATLSLEIDGVARELTADFEVREESGIPAPGMPALETQNLTIASNVRAGAIDSMADGSGEIPDPELHRWTIADAIEEGRPALVLFGTPAYCQSQFCGPEVAELQRLAADFADRAVFIHVEIWKEYRPPDVQVINEGAADWLLRELPDGTPEMTEPWLYLIGADGIIVDRWGSLFDTTEVAAALEALSPMNG